MAKEKSDQLDESELVVPANDEQIPCQAPGATADPLIGKVIAERLQILSLLGAGGMSRVYKAKHLLLDRTVAVKIIAGKADDKAIRRFQQEAKAATALNHANVAAVREFGVDGEGNPYLVMDYIDGAPLSVVIKQNGALSPERTKNIIAQTCAGLQHAHSLNVIHRDLKPANIIVCKDADGAEIAKIVDFGIAKVVDEPGHSSLTQTGEVFGTPNYMSPEQGHGKSVDARSDIYSVGCMMYECLTGEPPFSGASVLETLMKHTNEQPAPLKVHRASTELEPIVFCCLEKRPENRYQTAEELRQELLNPRQNKWRQRRPKQLSPGTRKKIYLGVVAVLCLYIGLVLRSNWPLLQSVFLPTPWQKLATHASTVTAIGSNNYETAKSLLFKALNEAEKGHASDEDEEALYSQLGKLDCSSEDWKSAIKYLARAIELNNKHTEDWNTGSLHDWMSEAYIRQDQFPQAINHAETAVRVKRKLLGERHPHTLFALFHLGQAYKGAKRFADAEKVDREALSIAQFLYPGGDDINLADADDQLATVLYDRGKVDEAIDHYKNSLAVSLKSRSKDNPQTITVRNALVECLRKCKRGAEADEVMKSFPK